MSSSHRAYKNSSRFGTRRRKSYKRRVICVRPHYRISYTKTQCLSDGARCKRWCHSLRLTWHANPLTASPFWDECLARKLGRQKKEKRKMAKRSGVPKSFIVACCVLSICIWLFLGERLAKTRCVTMFWVSWALGIRARSPTDTCECIWDDSSSHAQCTQKIKWRRNAMTCRGISVCNIVSVCLFSWMGAHRSSSELY